MDYKVIKPPASLSDFVESFWMLHSDTDQDRDIIILPDGRIDVIFSWSEKEPLHVMLMTLDLKASREILYAGTVMFAVSLKVPALEYILETSIKMEYPVVMPDQFWGITTADFKDFDSFVNLISMRMLATLATKKLDRRKLSLFKLIYDTAGSMSVSAMSEISCWTARQINRYFNERVGISLKEYCGILKFRSSFGHLKEGRLFPEGNFTDQAHFIKSIKKLSGVTPKELSKNKNDRFIQFSVVPRE